MSFCGMRTVYSIIARSAVVFLIVGAVAACSCTDKSEDTLAPADPQALVQNTLVIQGVKFEVLLPPEAIILNESNDGVTTIKFDTESIRFTHTIWIEEAGDDDLLDSVLDLDLESGYHLRYRVDRSQASGSGGDLAMLIGQIAFESIRVKIRCSDQEELVAPDPTWCIAYLHHLAPVAPE